MGNFISQILLATREFRALITKYENLQKRLQTSPGLPVSNPTVSFWTVPESPIASHLSELPSHADIVIIGAGLTGTSFARAVLDYDPKCPLSVVMLDARDACTGASGRNGGHINPNLYSEYCTLKEKHGAAMAKKIIQFRISHLEEYRRVAEEEGILEETQFRRTEHCDVYYTSEVFDAAVRDFAIYTADMPEEGAKFRVYNNEETVKNLHVDSSAVGSFVIGGGAINPYRLVTGILANLLIKYPKSFHLLTNTVCTDVLPPSATCPYYTLSTSRGSISTAHVIHATNGHVAHLLAPFRSKIIPVRATMTAQRPGTSTGKIFLDGLRSFVFYRGSVIFDYLTQLPGGEKELLLGGGLAGSGDDVLFEEVTNTDDNKFQSTIATHLSGALPQFVGEKNWGAEAIAAPVTDNCGKVQWNEGRVKAIWSGVIALSADQLPWVGRLPSRVSGRKAPAASATPADTTSPSRYLTASPGEWISAAYTGEGMVHAWLCAKALAYMVLGVDKETGLEDWFPDVMTVTETRWRKAKAENLLAELSAE